jgi:cytochrome c556
VKKGIGEMKLRKPLIGVVAALVLGCGAALAHDGVSGATKLRMDAMIDMGRALKGLHMAMRSGALLETPDAPFLIEQLMHKGDALPDLFAKREMPEASEARPEIWDDPDGFRGKIDMFNLHVTALRAAHEGGHRKQARAALRAVTSACSSCHQTYRVED